MIVLNWTESVAGRWPGWRWDSTSARPRTGRSHHVVICPGFRVLVYFVGNIFGNVRMKRLKSTWLSLALIFWRQNSGLLPLDLSTSSLFLVALSVSGHRHLRRDADSILNHVDARGSKWMPIHWGSNACEHELGRRRSLNSVVIGGGVCRFRDFWWWRSPEFPLGMVVARTKVYNCKTINLFCVPGEKWIVVVVVGWCFYSFKCKLLSTVAGDLLLLQRLPFEGLCLGAKIVQENRFFFPLKKLFVLWTLAHPWSAHVYLQRSGCHMKMWFSWTWTVIRVAGEGFIVGSGGKT